MNTYTVRLRGKREVADQTVAYSFEKPAEFSFKAGQYVAITLPTLEFEDARGKNRVMSIASAPSDDELVFAMRVTGSAFKQTLAHMPEGGEIVIRDAVGHFVLPEDDEVRPIVFLAGGIGITPVRSILREANRSGRKNPFWLFYSNRAAKDVAFLDELEEKVLTNLSEYHCINTLTNEADVCPWQDEKGFICAPMIQKYISDPHAPFYYIVGTPGFAQAMTKMLTEELGVAKESIKQDPFTGM